MIVDAHVHIGRWSHGDFLAREATLGDALSVFRDAGVGGAAIMPTDQCDNAGLLAAAREQVVGGRAGALWPFAWVRPIDEQLAGRGPGADDLAWVADNPRGLTGLKLHPSLSRVRVTDPGFAPALDLAARLGLVVLVHCGRWQEMASYRFAIDAARQRPEVRFLLAHAGGDTPPLATAAAELVASSGLDNVWFDIAGLREYWVIERNVRLIGAGRYLMGSDFCLAHPGMYIAAVAGMALDDAAKARILGDNARELFGAPLAAE